MKHPIPILIFIAILFLIVSPTVAYILGVKSIPDTPDKLIANRDKQCEGFTEAYEWVENAKTYKEMHDALRVWDIARDRCRGAVEIISLYEKGL